MVATLSPLTSNQATALPAPRPWLVVWTLAVREWVRFLRQPNRIFGAIGQPIMFWIVFAAGLNPSFRPAGASAAAPELSYGEFFFPGTLALILLFTAIFTTISIIEDRREGFLQSVLVAPVPRWSMVLGKILGGASLALAQAVLFLGLSWLVGIRLGPLAALAVVGWMFVLAVALTALGSMFAWSTDSTQGFHAVMSVILFPMWLLSGSFFPVESGWLAWIVRLNPLTYGVAGLRRLLYLGVPDPPLPPGVPGLLISALVTGAFLIAASGLAWRAAGRRTAGDLQ
ncbi:MAG: ABC transporter permease [Planctomycetaceae bacterium]|nr:ABC transporter permease [Planctomycetaceae bacterium]